MRYIFSVLVLLIYLIIIGIGMFFYIIWYLKLPKHKYRAKIIKEVKNWF